MSKRIKIKKPQEDTRLRIDNFYKRWNVDLNEAERWQNFKNRVLNSYIYSVGRSLQDSVRAENEFFEMLGIHIRKNDNYITILGQVNNGFENSPAYCYFKDATTIDFLLGLQVIFWMENVDADRKEFFWMDIVNAIVITNVPLEIKRTNSEIMFYPKGAKLLDERLVSDNLDWLENYPKSYESFKNALLEYGTKGKEREVVDNLRLSLELLIKEILQNKKSLENQKNEIGVFLKSKNVSTEVSNLFWVVLDYYSKYQNNKAKHENSVVSDEVEFILYLTGTLMRFLLTK